MTENNYRLEKEYKIPFEIFREGYTEFQKKFVFPQANVTALAFVILAVVFVVAVIQGASQYFAYFLIMVCLAMSVRQWYNPRKLRNNLFDVFRTMEEIVYRIGIGDNFVDISTVSEGNVENSAEDDEEYEEELPEKSRIPFDENFSLLEYDRFFLIFSGKTIFYIVPLDCFSESELEIIRGLKSNK
ncbi:MAG: YcxB family protein [Ruminococcus sp.]|nr:YcxB family protein [Ruminococcus sp.]MDE6847833.1 YcxB family protein [Ruminococcus sp.]